MYFSVSRVSVQDCLNKLNEKVMTVAHQRLYPRQELLHYLHVPGLYIIHLYLIYPALLHALPAHRVINWSGVFYVLYIIHTGILALLI